MSCCCELPLNLGCIYKNGGFVDIGFVATQDGVHKLLYTHGGVRMTLRSASIAVGQPVKFPADDLTGDLTYTGVVLNPDGTPFELDDGESVYGCLRWYVEIANYKIEQ